MAGKKYMKAITGILLAGFLALFLAGCGRESSKQSWTEDNSTDQLYSETQADTEFFLFQINGRVYTVDGVYPVDRFIDEEMEDGGFYRITADVTILNVWGTYCGPCKKEMPELAKLEEELPDNVQIIGIVLDVLEGDAEMTELAREICEDTNVSYTNIVVNDSMYEMLSGIEAIPTTFILNREGKTICEPIVGADVDAYKNAVMEYLE